jgi:hypothetical protein
MPNLNPPVPRLAWSVGEIVKSGLIRRATVYNLINRGELKAKIIANKRVIMDADLQAFIAAAPAAPLKGVGR